MANDLLNLYLSFLKIGSFSFGGAYSFIPIIEREIVTAHSWLSNDEFMRVLGMVEVIPGAISIKFATYTGYKVAGIPGAIVANLGNLTVPVLLIVIAAKFYAKFENNMAFKTAFDGIKFAVIGMILAIIYQYIIKNFADWKSFLFLGLGFSLTIFFKLHPAFIVITAGAAALLIALI
ncbi:MAG: chromate transporter [Ignavibacteriae bacterium]|nr:MAG: chromate transporter [Ignavibacteriota bacterium]